MIIITYLLIYLKETEFKVTEKLKSICYDFDFNMSK